MPSHGQKPSEEGEPVPILGLLHKLRSLACEQPEDSKHHGAGPEIESPAGMIRKSAQQVLETMDSFTKRRDFYELYFSRCEEVVGKREKAVGKREKAVGKREENVEKHENDIKRHREEIERLREEMLRYERDLTKREEDFKQFASSIFDLMKKQNKDFLQCLRGLDELGTRSPKFPGVEELGTYQ